MKSFQNRESKNTYTRLERPKAPKKLSKNAKYLNLQLKFVIVDLSLFVYQKISYTFINNPLLQVKIR